MRMSGPDLKEFFSSSTKEAMFREAIWKNVQLVQKRKLSNSEDFKEVMYENEWNTILEIRELLSMSMLTKDGAL